MSEMIFDIPLKILFAIIVILVVLGFSVFYLLNQKDAAERILSLIIGTLQSLVR